MGVYEWVIQDVARAVSAEAAQQKQHKYTLC